MLLMIGRYRQPPTPGHMCLNLRTQTSCQLTTAASFAPCKQPMPMLTDPCRKSYLKLLSSHASEHYPNSSYGVYPSQDDSSIAILLVANKYSPNNFWYGKNTHTQPDLGTYFSLGTVDTAPYIMCRCPLAAQSPAQSMWTFITMKMGTFLSTIRSQCPYRYPRPLQPILLLSVL